jgi:hypothetical protein
MDSQEGLQEFNETPTQSFTVLLQGGVNTAMKIHPNLKRNLLPKKKLLNGGRHFTSRGLAQY